MALKASSAAAAGRRAKLAIWVIPLASMLVAAQVGVLVVAVRYVGKLGKAQGPATERAPALITAPPSAPTERLGASPEPSPAVVAPTKPEEPAKKEPEPRPSPEPDALAKRAAKAELARRLAEEKARREAELKRTQDEAQKKPAAETPPPEAPATVQPTTRYAVNMGALGRQGQAGWPCKLPLEGLTAQWRVEEFGYWDEQSPPSGVKIKRLDGKLELMGRNLGTGADMTIARVSACDGGLLFEKSPGASDSQVSQWLANAAWVKLYCAARQETLFLLVKPYEAALPLRKEGQEVHGKLALPALLAEALSQHKDEMKSSEALKDSSGKTAKVKVELHGTYRLTVRLAYDAPSTPQESPDQVQQELRQAEADLDKARQEIRGAEQWVLDTVRSFAASAFPSSSRMRESGRASPDPTSLTALQQFVAALTEKLAAEGSLEQINKELAELYAQRTQGQGKGTGLDRYLGARIRDKEQAKVQAERQLQAATTQEAKARSQAWRFMKSSQQSEYRAADKSLSEARTKAAPVERRVAEVRAKVQKYALQQAEEKSKSEQAVGRFAAPLELRLGDQVVATFELKPAGS